MTLCRTFFSFAFLSLFPLLASHSFALDLRRGFSALQEVTWTRQGNDQVGPGTQILRITPVGNHPASWPEELAREEQARRRAQARRAHTWSGFLGTQPAWSVDGEVLEGVPEKARIRRRLEFWALAPGPVLVYLRADSPGGLGRRRAEKRFVFALRQLGRLQRGEIQDPFREIRLSPEGPRWIEEYRLALPSGLRVHLRGPVPDPLPTPPLADGGRQLWQRHTFRSTLPEAPEHFYQGIVPGYLIRFSPGFPSPREEKFLYNFLGFLSGVGVGREEEFACDEDC